MEQICVFGIFLLKSPMVRKLKFHEKKLLKKVDLVGFKSENNIRVIEVLRRYHIQKREDYTKFGDALDPARRSNDASDQNISSL